MSKINRKNYSEELEKIYLEKVDEMYEHCKLFDSGRHHFARSLATAIHMLCSNEGRENAILEQIGIRSRMRFYTHIIPASSKHKPILMTGTQLLGLQTTVGVDGMGSSSFALPPKKAYNINKLTFKDWWKQWVVLRHTGSLNLTNFDPEPMDKLLRRSEVIYYVRSQDGGSHFDPLIEAKFDIIKRQFISLENTSGGMTFSVGAGSGLDDEMFEEYPLFLVRSIAQELLDSLSEIDLKSFLSWK